MSKDEPTPRRYIRLRPDDRNPHNKTDVLLFRYGADPFGGFNQTTPGPLTVLINAMLGEESWFYPVSNATNPQEVRDGFVSACTRGLPFSTYTGYVHNGFASANFQCSFLNYPGKLPSLEADSSSLTSYDQNNTQVVSAASRMVAEWFSGFGYNASTQDALEAGLYLANEALLTLTADASKYDSARPIYVSSGTSVTKPTMRNPSKAVVSLLLLAEVVGLLALAWSSYRMPTFASRFDAVHVAAIGSQLAGRRLGAELPPLGLPRRGLARLKYLKKLEETEGLIGVQEEIEMASLNSGGGGGGSHNNSANNNNNNRNSVVTPRTSSTLTPGPSLNSALTQLQGASSSSRPSSFYGAQQLHRLSGSHASLSFTPRPVPRVNSYASSSHTNDEITSALDAVSEGNDPDGPPKYEDVVETSSDRIAGAAGAGQRRLVVGGSGRISRDMAKMALQPGRSRRARFDSRTPTGTSRPAGVASPLASGNRSNRSSAIGSQRLRSSRTA